MNLYSIAQKQIQRFQRANPSARWFLLATILYGAFLSIWYLFINFYILAQGFDRDYLGLFNSAPAAATLVLGIPLGMLTDRIGRKRSLLIGITVGAAAIAALLLTQNPAIIIGLAFIQGAGYSLIFMCQTPLLAKLTSQNNRNMLFSLNFSLNTFAGMLGNYFAGQMPLWFERLWGIPGGSAQSYRAVLFTGVVIFALMLIPVLFIRVSNTPAQEKEEEEKQLFKLQNILNNSFIKQVLMIELFFGLGAALLIPYFNIFFAERFSTTDQTLGIIFSLTSLFIGLGALLGPYLTKKLGTRIRAIVLTQGLSMFFLILVGFSPWFPLAVLGLWGRHAFMQMSIPLYDSFLMDSVDEKKQGTFLSLKYFCFQIGWTIGPTISGIVQKAYGFTPLFFATSILYVISISATWVFFRNLEKKPLPDLVQQPRIS